MDGAIHRAGGPHIGRNAANWGLPPRGGQDHHRRQPQGPVRDPYRGPVYKDGLHREPELLASCYRESLKPASAKGLSVAFPSISTGVYGYPMADAAKVALQTVKEYLTQHPEIERVRLVLFGRAGLRGLCQGG